MFPLTTAGTQLTDHPKQKKGNVCGLHSHVAHQPKQHTHHTQRSCGASTGVVRIPGDHPQGTRSGGGAGAPHNVAGETSNIISVHP